MLNITQNKVLEMIEEALGYRVSTNILRGIDLFYLTQTSIFNLEDTNKFSDLVKQYNIPLKSTNNELDLDSYLLESAFKELVENRIMWVEPTFYSFDIEKYRISFIESCWRDEFGEHFILRIVGENNRSQFAVFDFDALALSYYQPN